MSEGFTEGTPPGIKDAEHQVAPTNPFETRLRTNELLTELVSGLSRRRVAGDKLVAAGEPVIRNTYDAPSVAERFVGVHVTETVRLLAEHAEGRIDMDPIPDVTETDNYIFRKDRYGRTEVVERATGTVSSYDAFFTVDGVPVVARGIVGIGQNAAAQSENTLATLRDQVSQESIDHMYAPLREYYAAQGITEFGAIAVVPRDIDPDNLMQEDEIQNFIQNGGSLAVLSRPSRTFVGIANTYTLALNDLVNVRRYSDPEASLDAFGVELITNPLFEKIAKEMRNVPPNWERMFAVVRDRIQMIALRTGKSRRFMDDQKKTSMLAESIAHSVLEGAIQEFPEKVRMHPFTDGTQIGDYTIRVEGGNITVFKTGGDDQAELDDLVEVFDEDKDDWVPMIVEVKVQRPVPKHTDEQRANFGDFRNLRTKMEMLKVLYPGLSKAGFMVVSVAHDPHLPEHKDERFLMKRQFAEKGGIWVDFPITYKEFRRQGDALSQYLTQEDSPDA